MRHIALIGMMAAGKTSVGRRLADRLGSAMVDTDDVIESMTGRTVRQLWLEGDEKAYRMLERTAVLDALTSEVPIVLAVPGGVAVDTVMAGALDGPAVTVVYLRATVTTLADRVEHGSDHRPLLGDDPASVMSDLTRSRATRYEELADVVVDVEGRSPDDLARIIAESLGR